MPLFSVLRGWLLTSATVSSVSFLHRNGRVAIASLKFGQQATIHEHPADIDVACLYDHFSPWVLPQLEAFGFCDKGEAKDYIKDGHINRGGKLPVNPHGGQLGEAYIHGMNGIAEAVRQIRGSSVNQVDNAARVLITAGTGVPTGAAILERGE